MARRRTLVDGKKVTMNFHREDYERMAELYPSVGAQPAIRALVASHVRHMDAKRRAEVEQLINEIDLEEVPQS